MPPIVVACIVSYELSKGTIFRLCRPSLLVISFGIFELYQTIWEMANSADSPPNNYVDILGTLCITYILWYIESRQIRIRVQILAWAISFLAVQMLLVWFVFQVILQVPWFGTPRTLTSILLGRGEQFEVGAGANNYLVLYWPDQKLPLGFVRFSFFFGWPEDFALIAGFTTLLALDIRPRRWSLSLFAAGVFLLFVSGTRSNWVAFPLILLIRNLLVLSKSWGVALVLAVFAAVSFATLSIPPITNSVVDTFKQTTTEIASVRQESTDGRLRIYQMTLDELVNEPEKLFLGRGIYGPQVNYDYATAKVGSHSFILGSLLYRTGLLGTALFFTYWISVILHLYRTRSHRPIMSPFMIFYMTLTFATLVSDVYTYLVILILLVNDLPQKARFKDQAYA
jgi:hypothetical protein